MPSQIIQVRSEPGVKRDGTSFDGNNYVDAQWCRWQRGMPRKIGGYRQISNYADGVGRQFHTQALNNFVYTHLGYGAGLQQFTIDANGNTSAPADRTPSGFTGGDEFTWSFDALFDGGGSATVLIAVATNTLADISQSTAQQVYIGNYYASTALTAISGVTASGGVCVLHPYLFVYGTNGFVEWSDANDPTNFTTGDSGDAYIDSSKVVKMLPLRGGGQAPAGLIWTLDRVIRASYTGGVDIFAFDTISGSSSILSASSVIEYDGIFFWVGIDRFLMFNGVIKEVPNDLNSNYFFDGLNRTYANKVFAVKVPRFGEIWWCYPRGTATECTHAVVFNVREGTWYDTELPNGGRGAGIYAQVFSSPIMSGVEAIAPPTSDSLITEAGDSLITESNDFLVTDTGVEMFKVWRHEIGVDEIDGAFIGAVESYFETADITYLVSDRPMNRAVHIELIEPDFVQTGDMTVQVRGRINARATGVDGDVKTFIADPTEPHEQQVYLKEQRRELRLKFRSNTVNGDYQMGRVLAHIAPADGRYQS